MALVVTAACIGCKSKDCLDVCPVEAFHEGPDMLYINPESCIDCDACKVECPVDAIFHEYDVPIEMRSFIQLNAEMAQKYPIASF